MADASDDAATAAIDVDDEETVLDVIWDDPMVDLSTDSDGKFAWNCLHCKKTHIGKNQPKAVAHLTGHSNRSSSAKASIVFLICCFILLVSHNKISYFCCC